MRTETIEKTVYDFNDLQENQDLKAKVLNKYSEINVNSGWWEFTYDEAKEIGLKITEFDLDRNRHAKGTFILAANEVAQNIFNKHGETCETYKTAQNFMSDWQLIYNDYLDENSENYESREIEQKLIEFEKDFLQSILEGYSILLQKEYEYLTSETAILETFQANEYEFTENGNIY